jgi:hypothetical protein
VNVVTALLFLNVSHHTFFLDDLSVGNGAREKKANDIPGLDFWLPPNIPENESGLINLEEPLKLPFRTAHSSGFLHHPPPFQRQKRN